MNKPRHAERGRGVATRACGGGVWGGGYPVVGYGYGYMGMGYGTMGTGTVKHVNKAINPLKHG